MSVGYDRSSGLMGLFIVRVRGIRVRVKVWVRVKIRVIGVGLQG